MTSQAPHAASTASNQTNPFLSNNDASTTYTSNIPLGGNGLGGAIPSSSSSSINPPVSKPTSSTLPDATLSTSSATTASSATSPRLAGNLAPSESTIAPEKIPEGTSHVTNIITGLTGLVLSAPAAALEALSPRAAQKTGDAAEVVAQKLPSVDQVTATAQNLAGQAYNAIPEGTADTVKAYAGAATAKAQEILPPALGGATDRGNLGSGELAKPPSQLASEYVGHPTSNAAAQASQAVSNVATTVSQTLADAAAQAQALAAQALGRTQVAASDAAATAQATASDVANKTSAVATNAVETTRQTAVDVANKTSAAASNAAESTRQTAANTTNQASAAASNVAESTKQTANNLSNQAADAAESAKQTASRQNDQAQTTASNYASQALHSASGTTSSSSSPNTPGGSRTVGDQFGTVGVAPSGNQAVHGVATVGVIQPVDPSIGNTTLRNDYSANKTGTTATFTNTGSKGPYEKTEDELTGARTAL